MSGCGPCTLVGKLRPDQDTSIHRYGGPPAELTGTRIRLEASSGAWTISPADGLQIRVNGVRLRRPWKLTAGDSIQVGDARVMFFPVGQLPGALDERANGFSRARHHLSMASRYTRDDERSFLSALADLEREINTCEKMLALQPARKRMDDEDWSGGLALLDKVLVGQPDNAAALVLKAQCLVHLGRLDECLSAATSALEDEDENLRDAAKNLIEQVQEFGPSILLSNAIGKMNDDDFRAAETMLRDAASRYPDDAKILLHLAICQAKNGHVKVAKRTLDRAEQSTFDEETRGQIREFRSQLAFAGAEKHIERAQQCITVDDYAGAMSALMNLPAEVREIPQIKFLWCLARGHRLANDISYRYSGGDSIRQVINDFADVERRADDPELKVAARRLMGQLRQVL